MSSQKKLYAVPDGELYAVQVARVDGGYRVVCDSPGFDATVEGGDEQGLFSVVTERGSYETTVTRDNGEIHVDVGSERFSFRLDAHPGVDATGRLSARSEIKAPMPGKIVKVLVGPGETVSAGQGVVLFEAMKMQNEIQSPQDGVVGELLVEEGQAVEARDLLFVIQAHS